MKELYKKKGQMGGVIGAVIGMVVGIGVSVLVLILVGTLGGKTFQLVESDLDAITNETIRGSIKNAIASGFTALENTGDYLPIVVLAIIMGLVLMMVLGFTNLGGGGQYRGSAL